MTAGSSIAYVRTEDAPRLAPPPSTVGIQGWLRKNLFSSIGSSAATIVFGVIGVWIAWHLLDFAVFNATWRGTTRDACLAGENPGACWPMVFEKFPQWIYGFYPFDQRWRVNACFVIGALALIPMLIPTAPFKMWNALFLLIAYPLMSLILLTGGHFQFGAEAHMRVVNLALLASAAIPLVAYGIEDGIARNKLGLCVAGLGIILWLASFAVGGLSAPIVGGRLSVISIVLLAASVLSFISVSRNDFRAAKPVIVGWAVLLIGVLAAMLLLSIDFGLVSVETPQWGGLLVTLVIAVTGITVSLPVGILLALGRRSRMPVVRMLSVTYIELIRGVPLITVLFMSSVMFPLFLPPGMSFDKLLRALIGVAMFSSAYMAEVVRGGLQAIPKGQYEGAMAVGLSYWQMMGNIILPQALRISIPNIVGNFISLFKDTTLVAIIGLFDLVGILQAGLRDAAWASYVSAPTGYLAVALIYWVFCFGMSRYSMYTERRLQTGHKR